MPVTKPDISRDDAKRNRDELAAEGYRLLSGDTASFAAAVWPMAAEVWPVWVNETVPHESEGNSSVA